jgi:hypothetical protein
LNTYYEDGWKIVVQGQAQLIRPDGNFFNLPFVAIATKENATKIVGFNVEGRTPDEALEKARDRIWHKSCVRS